MYFSIIKKFIDLGVDMLPPLVRPPTTHPTHPIIPILTPSLPPIPLPYHRITGSLVFPNSQDGTETDLSHVDLNALTKGVHSQEALEMVREHLNSLLGAGGVPANTCARRPRSFVIRPDIHSTPRRLRSLRPCGPAVLPAYDPAD